MIKAFLIYILINIVCQLFLIWYDVAYMDGDSFSDLTLGSWIISIFICCPAFLYILIRTMIEKEN